MVLQCTSASILPSVSNILVFLKMHLITGGIFTLKCVVFGYDYEHQLLLKSSCGILSYMSYIIQMSSTHFHLSAIILY